MSAGVLKFIFQHLREAAAISDLVGDRIYPVGEVKETVRPPYITFLRVSNVHERHYGGGSGVAHPRWQIDCWARSALEAEQLGDAVRNALDNFKGDVDVGSETLSVRSTFLENDDMGFELPFDGSGRGVHRVRMDFTIWHRETITS